MKKRLKMILTASMLAFCLALMGFGVYAASSHTLGVQNTISFDIGDNIAFTIKAERTAPSGNLGSRTTAKEYYNQTSAQGGAAYEVGMADNDGKLAAWTMSDPVLLYATETITWDFTIVNKGGNPFYINMVNPVNPWGTNATLTAQANVLVPANETPITYTITFKVIDAPTFTQNLDSQALSFGVKLSKEEIADPNQKPVTYDKLKFTLVEDAENGSYYEVSAKDDSVSGEIVIPNTYKPSDSETQSYSMSRYASGQELPVKAIAEWGFSNNDITSVDFSGCNNLTIIAKEAFESCYNLKSVDLSGCDKLDLIEDKAFSYCYKLVQIKYNNNAPAFSNTPTYSTFGLGEANPDMEIANQDTEFENTLETVGDYVYYTSGSKKYLMGLSVEKLYDKKQTLLVDSNVTDIYQWAFDPAIDLLSVDLSLCANLTTIGSRAFGAGSKIVQIKYNSNAPLFSNTPTYETFGLYDENMDLEIVNHNTEFKNTLETVGDYVYYLAGSKKYLMGFSDNGIYNTEIKDVDVDITDIYTDAFWNNQNITSINLSGYTNLKTIGENAFFCCEFLRVLNISNCNKLELIDKDAFEACEIIRLDFSGCINLQEIDSFAFFGCDTLISIDMSDCINLKRMGLSPFQNCYKLVQIKYNSNAPLFSNTPTYSTFGLREGENVGLEIVDQDTEFKNTLATVGDYDYYTIGSKKYLMGFSNNAIHNTEIKNVDTDITDIYPHAFCYNNNITSVDFSNCVRLSEFSGEYSIFEGCINIESINFSGCTNLNAISEFAFCGLPYLTIVNFDGCVNLADLGCYTFAGCYSLIEVDLTDCINLMTIQEGAFIECVMLTNIYLSSTVKSKITFGEYWKPETTTVTYK